MVKTEESFEENPEKSGKNPETGLSYQILEVNHYCVKKYGQN